MSNLTLACHACNQKKGNMPLEQFLEKHPEQARSILAHAKTSLRDAAAVNSTRRALFQALKGTGMDVEVASGGRMKWNRHRLHMPKAHCLDAVCVGKTGSVKNWQQPVLTVKATGRGSYQRTSLTKYGFPRGYLTRSKSVFGFQTGDMVLAVVSTGKKAGAYWGRVAIRASGSFNVHSAKGIVQGIHHRFCKLLQRADGYGYSLTKIATQERNAGT